MAYKLYSIGLCHHSVSDRPKRKTINSPVIMSIVVWVQLQQRVSSIMIDKQNHHTLMVLGEFGR